MTQAPRSMPPVPPPPPVNPGQNMRPVASPPPPPKAQGRAPNQPSLAQLVRRAYDQGYSDIHLGVGEPPRMRDRGEMMILEYPETDNNTFMSWLREILTEEEIQRFKKN